DLINSNLLACRFLWIEIGRADGNGFTLTGDTVNAVMQVVHVRRLVPLADAAFHGPVVVGVPDKVRAGADMAAKAFVIVIACAEGQRQVVADAPFVFCKKSPCGLFEWVQG